ncbi:Rap1a/Tai family immunity protein [Massilia agri]|uniref:Rap1a immunity protein domain-containing protein n=1 Tax=Massilia agri TaxID=1886785 RepID=A0ABT2AF52_9BURK|nr:Rap1a/Tai family immunity protein [Massilia agri]MCS0594811.1 hypothetical protein [Massilia agri]
MTRLLLIVLIAGAMPAAAQPASVQPWMTGERLVKLLGNVDPSEITMTPNSPFSTRAVAAEYLDMSNGQFVRGYIQAVHDATEGKQWCPSKGGKPMPHELEDDARRALQQLPGAQLKRNAADLIVEVWQKTWPCPAGQRRER